MLLGENEWMNSSFWGFMATVAFIVQTIVQSYYAQKAKKATEEVKQDLATNNQERDDKLKGIKETGDKVHILVNSSMSVALKSNATLARRLAEITGRSEDLQAAEIAEKVSVEHELRQAAVDKIPSQA